MARREDTYGFRIPPAAGERHAKAAQEFGAGAHPVDKELVVRLDDGRRVLVLAIDERRQRRVAELFLMRSLAPRKSPEGSATWRVLHGPEPLGPLAIRLDLRLRLPLPCRIHLLFSPRNDLVVRSATGCSHVCLVTEHAFAELEETGRCGTAALLLPAPPTGELQTALGAPHPTHPPEGSG